MKNVIKFIVLVSILTTFSCEKPSLENDSENLDNIENFNNGYQTDPGEDLEPGGSGGGKGSDKEDL